MKWPMYSGSHSSPSLLQICKKKMFATPLRIHRSCLRGEKESILNPIGLGMQIFFLARAIYSNWIVLFHTGGVSQGMNQGLKSVSAWSVFKALVNPGSGELNCTFTQLLNNVDSLIKLTLIMIFVDNIFLVGAPEIGDWASSKRRMLTYLILNLD